MHRIRRMKYEKLVILITCTICVLLYIQQQDMNANTTINTSHATGGTSDSIDTKNFEGALTFLNQTLLPDLVDEVAESVIKINVVSETQNPKITFGGNPM